MIIMTWIPIWNSTNKIMISPLVIPFLSYGLYAFVGYGDHKKEVIKKSHKDVISHNYNPFLFRKN